jgi:Ca2+-transporting ATPase
VITEVQEYYQLEKQKAIEALNTDADRGLNRQQVSELQQRYGKNRLESGKSVSAYKILLHNINNIIVYLLLAASIVSFLMNDPVEGVAILIAVFIAVFFGFAIELKAQKSIESLQSMIHSSAKVVREGALTEINAQELVPGDVIFLEEGDSIAADARLLTSQSFACIESALTGESEAVEKDSQYIADKQVPLGDRINVVYAGTAVTRGNAYAVVTSTGMQTQIGKISSMLKDRKKEVTPLNKELGRLGKLLILFGAICAIIVILLGFVTGRDLPVIVQLALILAIAAIPEAMPAVATITLARGMNIMAKHKALVKSLTAVETLGSTSVICTDKTGTLTENQMTVKKVYLYDGKEYTVGGSGYQPEGNITSDEGNISPDKDKPLEAFIRASVLCSNATLAHDKEHYSVIGDPTEGSLVVLGEKAGYSKAVLERESWTRIGEIPFNSKNKYMVTAYRHEGQGTRAFIKGAPDVLLERSLGDEPTKKNLFEINQTLAGQGMRVLAVGELQDYQGDGDEASLTNALNNVHILGLAGIIDPPREDVAEAIETCQAAGIQVRMITGDHPKTASIIAEKIGIRAHENTMTGLQLDELAGNEHFDDKVEPIAVFARVSPENKLQIVDALKRRGLTVAMTGDGVNDAPALHGADIGVAMGIRGTEVAKEASDMILTDDRFSTIVEAVREGRIIYANIRKFVHFLFSCNVVEILAVLLSMVFLLPIPISPLHILWLNLVVDIFPAMSMGFETAEQNAMKQPPRGKGEGLIATRFLIKILTGGAIIGISSFVVFSIELSRGVSLEQAQTATFTMMAVAQLLHIFNVRREKTFGFDSTLIKNKVLLLSLFVSLALQLIVVYVPFFNGVMGTVPLGGITWMIILAAALFSTGAVHVVKKALGLK